jgi:hypothetical protein
MMIFSSIVAVSCGTSTEEKSGNSRPAGEVLWGKSRYSVDALVINESNNPIDVIFLNNGPHDGGCDSKNWVPFRAEAKSIIAPSETWYCSMDQVFGILVKHPKGDLSIKGVRANVICSDEGCRQIDVK